MLAIKECLIREGVLNLDSHSRNHNPIGGYQQRYHQPQIQMQYQLHGSKSSSNMDMPRYCKTIAASSDLSTAPATAKTSCHKPQEKSQTQILPSPASAATKGRVSEDSSGASKSSGYRGQHPHFHHHTTPAYYTDLQLRIHTPQATDVGALNENYQSVYATPSCNTQLVEQRRSFPKSATATATATATTPTTATRATFFRGDAASTQDATRRRQRPGSEGGSRYFKFSPGSVSPTKGEETSSHPLSQSPTIISPSHSTTRTRTTNRNSCSNPPVETASPVPVPLCAPAPAPTVVNATTTGGGRNSRHKQRFHQRSKRAVRVRSESRPISALYDIICKEKNQDEGDSTTSSSSSGSNSSGNSSSNERKKEQQQEDKDPITDKLATFWPLHHRFHSTPPQSMQKELPLGGATTATATSLTPRRGGVGQPESSSSTDSLHALHSSHKCMNLVAAKAASLPPQPARRVAPPAPVPVSHHQRLARSLEPSAKTTAPPPSADVRNYNAGRPVSTERLFVEPPKVSGQAVQDFKRRLINQGDGQEDGEPSQEQQFDQGEVFDTLARWQQELTSAGDKIQLVNGATDAATVNGHHDLHEHHHHLHLEHDHPSNIHQQSLPSVEPTVTIPKHQNQHPHQSSPQHQHPHQATNARRFITRTTRSHSRQGSATGGHHTSPPPPLLSSASASAIGSSTAVGYHSDSSYSSPSPTRRRNKPLIGTGTLSTDPQSSANGNSSAYETAATTVMTHGTAVKAPPPPRQQKHQKQHRDQQQQQQQLPLAPVEVPKAESKPQPPTETSIIAIAACPDTVAATATAATTAASAGNSDL
ncbi:flocculation protein FLO11-like [Drosophila obscura]|uniref:flocculation protein FLO11-like n=1 Tax=Drosophila obscura TaxID=7282 RepID=UPI001BB15014|nr:flocculation protein FLO11-like [Drosophila obscura]